MSAEWLESTLGDVTKWLSGGTPKKDKAEYWKGDIPWISANSMYGSRFSDSDLKITEAGLNNGSRIAPKNSILLLVRGGALHNRLPVGMAMRDVAFNQDVKAIISNEKIIQPWYLLYWLIGNERHLLESIVEETGIGAGKLDTKRMQSLVIRIPPIFIQNKIVNVVKGLDDKIELNRQTNQTLEQIAQTIFKSWFVDFEPTRAKIAAKEAGATAEEIERAAMCAISGKSTEELDQLSPEAQQQLETTAALFPDALVESELGEIPAGWAVKEVGNYLDTVSKTYPLKSISEVIFLNTGDIQNGKFLHFDKSEVGTLPGQAKKSIQKGDILYSEIRPENKRFAYVYFDSPNHVVSTKLMVLRQTKEIPSLFLYFLVTQRSVIDYLQMLAESRSGTFPQITFDELSKVKFIGPTDNLLVSTFVQNTLEPFFKLQQLAENQNKYLSELRDSLLPKLLSGELVITRTPAKAEAVC